MVIVLAQNSATTATPLMVMAVTAYAWLSKDGTALVALLAQRIHARHWSVQALLMNATSLLPTLNQHAVQHHLLALSRISMLKL
jgi:hypothetical protein